MRFGLLAWLTFAQLVSAEGAVPPKGPLSLDWNAEPSCSSAAQIVEEVSRVLRGASGSERSVFARVNLERDERAAWQVTILTRSEGASRTRRFEAESCAAAAEAVAVILAIAVNPRASPAVQSDASLPPTATPTATLTLTLTPTPTPTPTPTAAAAAAAAATLSVASAGSAQPAAVTSPVSPDHGTLRRLTVAASLATDAGNLPTVAAGAELAVGWHPGRLRFEIVGDYWGQQTAKTAAGAGAGFQLLSGAARAVYAWSAGRVALGPLLDLGVEWLKASGFGGTVANGSPAETLWTVGAGGLVTWHVAWRIDLRLALEGVIPLSRPSFVVLDPPASPTLVYRPWPVFGRALLGTEVQF